MDCIKCGRRAAVTNSCHSGSNRSYKIPKKYNSVPDPFVYRDHKCTICRHNFQSIELPALGFAAKTEKLNAMIREIAIVTGPGVKVYRVGNKLNGEVVRRIKMASIEITSDLPPVGHYCGYGEAGNMLFSINCLIPCEIEYFNAED